MYVERCLAGGGVNANFIPEQISWIEGQEMEGGGGGAMPFGEV